MDVHVINCETEWEALADRVLAPLPQRWLYGEAARRVGREVRRLCISDRAHPVALAQVVMRPLLAWRISLTSRGPLFLRPCDRQAAVTALRRALPAGVKLMSPEDRLGRLRLSAPPEVAELDLTPPVSALRAGLDGKWRNALKKAENTRREPVQTRPSAQTLMPLLHAEKRRQAAGRYRALPPEFTLAIQKVAPDSLRLFSGPDAQMLFIRHGTSATYHIGHSGPEGRRLNAHNLLLWNAIEALRAEGVLRLDLGTIDRDRAPTLARFKLRSGAQARRLGPAGLL